MSNKNKIFNKTFRGCTGKNIYPTKFVAGDDVPFDLEAAAVSVDAIETDAKKAEALVIARAKQVAKAEKEEADADK